MVMCANNKGSEINSDYSLPKTDSNVEIFSQSLKTISEGQLRHLFEEKQDYDENQILFAAGLSASAQLNELPQKKLIGFRECVHQFAKELHTNQSLSIQNYHQYMTKMTHSQWICWENLINTFT